MSVLGSIVVWDRCLSCSLGSLCIYECSDEGENGNGEEGSEISGGGKRMEIA